MKTPTALLNVDIAKRNIQRMADKAEKSGVRFRPHFKTHQSAIVGEWFREMGISAITVSSFTMAEYFAMHGWQDITVAFPVNWHEIDTINALAAQLSLNVLVESVETAQFLADKLIAPVGVYLKVDAGYYRTGLWWEDIEAIRAVATIKSDKMTLKGLLVHDGHTYDVRGHAAVAAIYQHSVSRLHHVRDALSDIAELELSPGDTPACSLVDDFSDVDEIRPGNFVFYDWMQVGIGSCQVDDIAVAVGCPVVAIHPERSEITLYGGAIHLSKDSVQNPDGRPNYGVIATDWGQVVPDTYLRKLSQEHGIVKSTPDFVKQVTVGDVLMVYPIHSCLTVDLLKCYQTTDGQVIPMMGR